MRHATTINQLTKAEVHLIQFGIRDAVSIARSYRPVFMKAVSTAPQQPGECDGSYNSGAVAPPPSHY
jgi:hypothetical protein